MNVVRLSALRIGNFYPRKYSWYSFLLEAESTPDPWCGRKEFVNEFPITPSGIESENFRLVAHCLNKLHHGLPPFMDDVLFKGALRQYGFHQLRQSSSGSLFAICWQWLAFTASSYLTLRLLISYIYIYGAPILDVSRSHTTTHHSR